VPGAVLRSVLWQHRDPSSRSNGVSFPRWSRCLTHSLSERNHFPPLLLLSSFRAVVKCPFWLFFIGFFLRTFQTLFLLSLVLPLWRAARQAAYTSAPLTFLSLFFPPPRLSPQAPATPMRVFFILAPPCKKKSFSSRHLGRLTFTTQNVRLPTGEALFAYTY